VRLVLDEEKTDADVARALDLMPSALGGWVKQAHTDRDGGTSGLKSDERAELVRIRKELRVAKMERDILGKALAAPIASTTIGRRRFIVAALRRSQCDH
jgi:transposase